MPRRSNLLTYVALGWLALLVLAVNAGVPVPEGLGLAIVGLTFWALGVLYFRAFRRWPVFGWLALGIVAGLFGGGYHSSAATFVEREYDDGDCVDHADCDNCDN